MAEKPAVTSIGGTHTAQIAVATIALGTADEVVVWKNNTGATVRITQAGFLPDTAVTGNTTDNFILQFRNKGTTGGGTTGITDTKTYGTGTDISQFVEDALVLSSTLTDRDVADGETVTLNKTETGSGLALPAGLAALEYQFSQ